MSALAQQQQRFAARLAEDAADLEPGLAVYRRTIASNYRHALAATYPVVRTLVGARAFDALAAAYAHAHPSTCGDLNVYGAALADFIDAHGHDDGVPCLSDMARLEWAMDESSRAADPRATPAEVFARLQQLSPDRVADAVVPLQPDCRLLRSRFRLLRHWQRRDASPADTPITDGGAGDCLMVRRRADGLQVERLAPGEHAWLHALASGATLGAALSAALTIDPAFDVASAVGARIADGTLDAPHPG